MRWMFSLVNKLLLSLKYPGFFSELEKIKTNPYKPISQLVEEQNTLLRSIIRFAFKEVPYYRKLSEELGIEESDISTQEDLQELPILTKADISRNPALFVPEKRVTHIVSSTGGSTGEPLKYLLGKECSKYNQLIKFRNWGIAGFKPGEYLCTFAGGSLYDRHENIKKSMIKKLINVKSFSSYGVTRVDLETMLRYIEDKRPGFFYGYASAWSIFAEFLCSINRKLSYKPKALFSTSEVLLRDQREMIERVMRVEVFDTYSLNDSGASAHECERHDGLHIDFERTILQVVDDNGKPVNEGTGRVIATSLRNYAFPFIRYDTGDVATISSNNCSCGRNTPRLMSIDGRSTDFLCIDGRYVGSPVLTVLMGKFNIRSYRIVQESSNQVVFHIVLPHGTKKDSEEAYKIRKGIGNSFSSHIPAASIEVVFYETMNDLEIENKHRLVVNKMKK